VSISVYHQLSLDWSPRSSSDKAFKVIMAVVFTLVLLTGFIASSIKLPVEKRQVRSEIPERIARILFEKKKQRQEITRPKIKPVAAKPKPKPKAEKKPKVKKIQKPKEAAKSLTKKIIKARDIAAQSGLIALSNELADLMDTSDISNMVSGKVKLKSNSDGINDTNQQLLLGDTSTASVGIKDEIFNTNVRQTQLTRQHMAKIEPSIIEQVPEVKAKQVQPKTGQQKSTDQIGIRGEEEVTFVFDQNKSILFSLYNRARRSNPGLKGKIILKLTIQPSGKVSLIEVVSNELTDKKLVTRIIQRIRNFKFSAKSVAPVTVTYPIEFLPS